MTAEDLPKTSWKRTRPFRLGDLEVRPNANELLTPTGVRRLRPLLMEVLLRLAAEPGEVVARETLIADVWQRRMVNDEVLSRAIAELRTALGDDARGARYVETLPKAGYRLVAPVRELEPSRAAARPARARALRIAALAIVAAVIAAFAWTRHAATPTADRLVGLLATARPLTSDPGNEVAPRFSPDGEWLVYGMSGEGATSRIMLQRVDGSQRRAATPGDALVHSPIFFPDGKRLAYWKRSESACGIFELDLHTNAERRLLDCALRPRPRFDLSRDGRRIVFTGDTRAQWPAGVYVMELDGAAPHLATQAEPGMGDDLFPRFSPDGTRIAFFRGNESHRRPWIVSIDRPEAARAVGTVEGLSYGMTWLGNDGPLLVAADWLGFRALNVLDLANGSARIAGARGARFPDSGPHGEIAYESAVYSSNLSLLALQQPGREPQPLWPSTRYTSQAEFSPDGRAVLFSSNRDGFDAIYVAPLDGEPRRILGREGQRYFRPHWSADGRMVYAVRGNTDTAGSAPQEAVRIALDGGREETVDALGRSVGAVVPARDGRHLYVGENSGHAMRLMRVPVDRPGNGERLPWPLVSYFGVNAERIVFLQPQLDVATSCRLDTLACEPLGARIDEENMFHWALGPRSLFFRRREGATTVVDRYDLASGRIVETIAVESGGAGASLAVAADESALIAAREEGPAIDLMIAR